MKSLDVAVKYNIAPYELDAYIKSHATFPFKENFWGEIIIPDDVDIESFLRPLITKKEETTQKVIATSSVNSRKNTNSS